MAFDAFFPKITLPSKKTDVRKGGGLGIRVARKFMVADAFQGGEATNGLIAWLKENNAEQIDLAVATHAHGDHTGGFYDIVEAGIPIKEFRCYHIDSIRGGNDESRKDSDNLLKLIRWLQIRGTRVLFVDHGDVIKFEDISWHIYRNQPARAAADDTYAWAYVNNGSLVLYSPELQGIIFGDGPENPKDAIAYFQKKFGKIEILIWFLISHHGNNFSLSNAEAAKDAGAKFAYESCVEADGPGTTSWTEFGARRVFQQNITVWMQNQNIYIHAAAGKITFKQGSKTLTFNIPYQGEEKEGWVKNSKGWWYRYKDGSWPADCKVELPWSQGKSVFCFNKEGYMVTGWQYIDGKWYYFDKTNGDMVTGWVYDNGCWYFLDYKTGVMLKGWHKLPHGPNNVEDWYLLNKSGEMLSGWQWSTKDGKTGWYYLDPDNGMRTGWIYDDGEWYCLGDDGRMLTGWVTYKGRKCYLEPLSDKTHVQGVCYRSRTAVIDGKSYKFDKDGYATEEKGGGTSINRSKKIIDISEFQGDVNWAKASTEVGAVYIRCGLRGSLKETAPADYKKIRYDRKWARNLSAVQTYGIPFSAYYFPTAITDAEALEGAKWFYEQVKDLNLAFPPALDSENVWGNGREAGRANGLSKSERTRLLKIVTDYFNARGMNIGIYASASWLNSKIDMGAFPQCVRDCTWVADSTGAVDYKGYYWLHQYGKGACAGFGGDVDLNKITGTIPPVRIGGEPQTTQSTEDPIDVLIRIMEAEVGTHEGSNNHTKYGDEMHAIQPSNMDKNAPWCDAFFDWCILKLCEYFGYGADMARMVLCGNFDDYTYASVALYKKAGRWFDSPQRGDQIFFGGQGHTGGVVSVNGGTENTIEGNKGDEVRRCSYSIHSPSIIGYGRPKYYLLTGKITAADMPLVKKGSKGEAVKRLQEILNGKGYKLTVDGDFGNKTDAAVRAFQKANHLTIDGEVGPMTWAALLK